MDPLQRMREAIREQRYRISAHANDEMADDDLIAVDIESIILTGRSRRYLLTIRVGHGTRCLGRTTDGRQAYVVCTAPVVWGVVGDHSYMLES